MTKFLNSFEVEFLKDSILYYNNTKKEPVSFESIIKNSIFS